MRKLSKGYGKFAFMLLVFAMCLTAFVVTPFYNTQTYALPYKNDNPSITKSHYTSSEIIALSGEGAPDGHERDFQTFFHNNDLSKAYFGENRSSFPTDGDTNSQIEQISGMQFLPNYYDLATGAGIFNKKTITKNTFATGNFKQTVTLADMVNYFGIGTGVPGKFGNKNGANIYVSSTPTDQSNVEAEQYLHYKADGKTNIYNVSTVTKMDWRKANGYFYTYIKVPTELANSLTVKANARMKCQGWHSGWGEVRSLLVLDLQVGELQGSNYGPGDFVRNDGSQYVSKDVNDKGSGVNTLSWRSTGEVPLNGSTWIKLSATVLTANSDYGNNSWAQGGLGWNNELLLQEVQLEFSYTSPYLAPTYTVDKANEFTKDNKAVDLELYYQLNGDYQTNYKVEIYKVNGEISTYKGEALPRVDVPVDTDSTNNKKKYTLRFSGLDENGTYEARLTSKNGQTKFETVRFTVAKIDKGKPSEATMSVDSRNNWFTTNDANRDITISNIRDTSHDGTTPSGVDYINLYLKKVEDTYTFNKADLNNFATNAEGRLENKAISGTTCTFKLSDIISDLFTAEDKTAKYGRYVLFYQVRDKVGNMSEYYGIVIDYDNGAVIDIDKFMLSQGETWVTSEVFGENWITGGIIYVKFNLTETYHFTPNFEFSNVNGNTIAFNGITITFAKDEVQLDNLIVESGYYYASFEAKTLTEGKAEFNEKVYVKGGYRNINVINTDSAQIMVDVKKPFTDENGEILSYLFDVEKRWYTFADSIYEDHTTKGKGIWLVIDASKEGLQFDEVFARYNFGDLEVRQNNYKQIEVFLPLENKAGNVVTFTVIDQAGNKSTISTPSIDFDSTQYDIGKVLVSHSNENIPPMVTFLVGDSSDVSIAVPTSLEDIQNETFHRGQYIFVKFDNTDVYEYYAIKQTTNGKNPLVSEGVKQIVVGEYKDGDTTIANYDINVLIFKYIDINVYMEGTMLSDDPSVKTEVEYDGTDRTLVVKDASNETNEIENGIISKYFVGNKWQGIKYVMSQGYAIDIDIKDTTDMFTTRGVKTVYLQINPKSVNVELLGDYTFTDKDGKKIITTEYGRNVAFNVEYKKNLVPEDQAYVNMVFGVLRQGVAVQELNNVEIGTYDLIFTKDKNNHDEDRSANYKFNFVYKGQTIGLQLEVIRRKVHLELENLPTLNYGGPFDLSNIAITLLSTDISDLATKPTADFNGKLELVNENGVAIKYNSPVGTYYFSTSGLSLKENGKNFELVVDREKYSIALQPKTITLVVSDKILNVEYGTVPNFLATANLSFKEGLVYGDNIDDILQHLQLTNAGDFTQTTDTGTYTLTYALKENAEIKNYNVQFDTYQLTIRPKTLYVSLDVNKSVLEKTYDGVAISDFTKYLVANIDGITGFIGNDKEKYNFDGAKNAFTIKGEVKNANVYSIVAVDNYDALVTTTGKKNYKFVPQTDYKFTVKAKRVSATITGFTTAKGNETDFAKLHRPFLEAFADAISAITFTMDGVDNSKFAAYIDNELAVTFMNDTSKGVGSYKIVIRSTEKDSEGNLLNNYEVTHNEVYFYIDKALYAFNADSAISDKFGNVVYTGKVFVPEMVVTTDNGKTIRFNVFTKEAYVDAGTGYKLYIDVDSATISDNNYSGVKFNKTEYDFDIKQLKLDATIFEGLKYEKVFDNDQIYNFSFKVPGIVDEIIGTAQSMLDTVDAGSYSNRNIIGINYTGAKANNYDFTAVKDIKGVTIVVKKRTVELSYNGSSVFTKNDATLKDTDFAYQNTIGSAKPTLKLEKDNQKFDLTTSFADWFTAGSGDLKVVVDDKNYEGSITISVKILDGKTFVEITLKTDINSIVYSATGKKLEFALPEGTAGEIIITYYVGSVVDESKVTQNVVNAGEYVAVAEFSNDTQYGRKVVNFNVKPVEIDVKGSLATNQNLNKDFDGKTDITIALTDPNKNYGVGTENVTITVKGNFADKFIGENKTVSYASAMATSNGANLNNYLLVNGEGEMTEKGIIAKRGTYTKENALTANLDLVNGAIQYGDKLTYQITGKLLDGYEANVGGTLEYNATVADNVKVENKLYSEYYVIKLSADTINIIKRDVKVFANNITISAGTDASKLSILAEFVGVLDVDSAAFRAIANKILKINETGALTVGEYVIVKNDFELTDPVFNNYNLIFTEIGGKVIVVGASVIAEFGLVHDGLIYSDAFDYNALITNLLNTLKFTKLDGDEVDISGDKANLEIYFVDIRTGREVDVRTANAGTLAVRVRYKDGATKNYSVDDYSANSTKIAINPKRVTLKYNPDFFSTNEAGVFYKVFVYGFSHTGVKISDVFTVVDEHGSVVNGTLNGKFLLHAPMNENNKYNANNKYTVVLDSEADIWFTNDVKNTYRGNYLISEPTENNYFVRVEQKEVTISLGNRDGAVGKEFGNNDPNLDNFYFIISGIISGDSVNFTKTALSRAQGEDVGEYDFILNGTIDNPNYKLKMTGSNVATGNKFVITKRIIVVDEFIYNKEKEFDNTTDVGASGKYHYKNPMATNIDINTVVTFDGELSDINVASGKKVVFKLTINPDMLKNFAFELASSGVKVNGVVDKVNVAIEGNDVVLSNQTVNVTPANITISVPEILEAIIAKEYNGTTDMDLTVTKNVPKAIEKFIDKLNVKAMFSQKDVGENLNVTFVVDVVTSIENFTTNVNVTVNNEKITFTTPANNTYNYLKNLQNARITPFIIKAEGDSYVRKTYDRQVGINTGGDSAPVQDGFKYTFTDGSEVYLRPVLFGDDKLDLIIDFKAVEFPEYNAGNYVLNVPAKLADGANPNYRFEGGALSGIIYLVGEILKRDVTIKINPAFQSEISKVYDGTTLVNVDLQPSDYIIEGIIDLDKDLVGIKATGGAEFIDEWAGIQKKIVLNGAELSDLNVSDDLALHENYNLVACGTIEGLTGTINPRPVNIDAKGIVVYNTRYKGPDGSKYSVNLIHSMIGGTKENVEVYMPLENDGILTKDEKYKLQLDMSLMLDDGITGAAQDIYLNANIAYGFKSTAYFVDETEKQNAIKAQQSYQIGNHEDIFSNADSNGRRRLTKGSNVDTSLVATGAKTYIKPFEITNSDITFTKEVLNKTYDGNNNLNSRIIALVRRSGYDFLKDEIRGITIKNTENVYSGVDVGIYDITLELDTSNIEMIVSAITKSSWYTFAPDFVPFINIKSEIVPRVVNVKAEVFDKEYDGTKNAISGKHYKLTISEAITGKLEGLMPNDKGQVEVLCDAKYNTENVSDGAVLTLSKFRFNTEFGNGVYKNYKIKVIQQGVQVEKVDIANCKIVPKKLTLTLSDLKLEYGDKLPSLAELKNIITITPNGFIGNDSLPDSFVNSIEFVYTSNDFAPGMILDANLKLNTETGKYEANNKAISIKFDSDILTNYYVVVEKADIEVAKLEVTITLDEKSLLLSSKYGNNANDIESIITFSNNKGAVLDADKLLRYIILKGLPTALDNVGEYPLSIGLIESDGITNYTFKVDEFNSAGYVYTINPADIEYRTDSNDYTFEYEQDKDYKKVLLNKFVVTNVAESSYVVVNKILGVIENGEFVEKDIMLNEVSVFTNLAIKFVVHDSRIEKQNYEELVVTIGKVEITPKKVVLNMKPYTTQFDANGGTQIYPDTNTSIPTLYKDVIKTFIIDANGNVVENVSAIGKYTVIAYSNDAKFRVSEQFASGFDTSKILDKVYRDKLNNGFAVANFNVTKIKVNVFIKQDEYVATSDSAKILEQFMKNITLDNKNLTSANIKLPNAQLLDFTKPTIKDISVSLIGQDVLGNSCDNYELVFVNSPTITIGTNKITDSENKDWTISSVDNGALEQNLVVNGVTYRVGNKHDIQSVFNKDFLMFNSDIVSADNVNFMVRVDGKLTEKVNVKLNVTGADTKKGFYLVNDFGVCKKIDDVKYVTEGGKTYAVFTTDELGWFVFADAEPNTTVIAASVAIGVMSAIIVALIVVLAVGLHRKKKAGIR